MSTQNTTDRTTRSNRGIDHERLEEIPDVAATSNTNRTNQKTPSPTDTSASPTSSAKKITMADIQAMMDMTVRKVTADLNARHKEEMSVQTDAVKDIEAKFKELQLKTEMKKDMQASPFETPRAARPQDLAYQEILTTSKKNVKVQKDTNTSDLSSHEESVTDTTLQALLSLMSAQIKSTNSKETTTDLPKFSGKDAQWERWYELLRSYLQAKGWLDTFDHPIGPGTPGNLTEGFDYGINEKIYQKIQSKCYEGTASTYVRMAAEFDGHDVGQKLRTRYHGYSQQKLESYKKLIKELRHTSGTSMPLHVDRFETIIGHMPGCGYIPTTTEKVDWFLPSVAENTYAAAKAHCQAKKLTGGLEYSDMVKLYNHTCFEKYPHFQLAELQSSNLSQNTNRIGGKPSCLYHPGSNNHTTEECDKFRQTNFHNTRRKDKKKPNNRHNHPTTH